MQAKRILLFYFTMLLLLLSFLGFSSNNGYLVSADSETQVVSVDSTQQSLKSAICADTSGNVHVVWGDPTNILGAGSEHDIFYRRWNKNTQSWGETELVSSESSVLSQAPSIEADSLGNIHVAWKDAVGSISSEVIYYKRWMSSSSTWTTAEVVSTESTADSEKVDLTVDTNNNVHITWSDSTDYDLSGTDRDIFYKQWFAANSSWSTTKVISTESTSGSSNPKIFLDIDQNIHIIWQDSTNLLLSGTDDDIFYKRYNSTSGSWMNTEIVSVESSGNSRNPSFEADNLGDLHATWLDYTDYNGCGTDIDIFYKQWFSTNNSWSEPFVVSSSSTDTSLYPDLSGDYWGRVHIVWDDYTNIDSCGTDRDIFYRERNEAGYWNNVTVVSTESTLMALVPSIDVDLFGLQHIVWGDETNIGESGYDRDVHYKQLGIPLVPEVENSKLLLFLGSLTISVVFLYKRKKQ